MFKNNS